MRAELIDGACWHVTVDELPATWTVAFATSDIGARARARIALDLGLHSDHFDVTVVGLPD